MRLIWMFLACLAVASSAFAAPTAETDHATLRLIAETPAAGEANFAAVHFKLEEGWHIYWKNPGDSGLEAQISWELPEGLTAGPIHWPPAERIEYSGLFNYGYEGEVSLMVPLERAEGELAGETIIANVEFLICKDICIPQEATLSTTLDRPLSEDDRHTLEQGSKWLPRLLETRAEYDINGDEVFIAIDLSQTDLELPRLYHAWWYPVDSQVISNASEQQWRLDGTTLILSIGREGADTPEAFSGVLELASTDGRREYFALKARHVPAGQAMPTDLEAPETQTAEAPEAEAEKAITSSDVKNLGLFESPGLALISALLSAFLGGIILNIMPCVLPVLSLKALSIAKKSGAAQGAVRLEGIAYTLGILVSFAAIAGGLIALQQAGQQIGWGFQLQSAGFISALIYLLFLIALNLSGVFEVPSNLMNAGGGLAEKSGPQGAFFTGVLAAVVATPCTAPFMATAVGFALSQPPATAIGVFLALGFGLAFPFILITFIPGATRLLPKPGAWMERFRQFLAFPMYATVIWLLWVLTQQAGAMGMLHALIGLLMIGFALWLMRALPSTPIKLLIIIATIGGLIAITETEMAPAAPTAGEHKEAFSMEALQRYRSEGRPVFVNATAAWCITCKVNERVALRDNAVQAALTSGNIVYLEADWTNRNAEIATYLESFGRSGVPLYAYYAPGEEPVLLPQLLTPSIVLDAIQAKGDSQ